LITLNESLFNTKKTQQGDRCILQYKNTIQNIYISDAKEQNNLRSQYSLIYWCFYLFASYYVQITNRNEKKNDYILHL